jgi:hypothetical protein
MLLLASYAIMLNLYYVKIIVEMLSKLLQFLAIKMIFIAFLELLNYMLNFEISVNLFQTYTTRFHIKVRAMM